MTEEVTFRIMGCFVEADGETAEIVSESPFVQTDRDRELVKDVALKRYKANHE